MCQLFILLCAFAAGVAQAQYHADQYLCPDGSVVDNINFCPLAPAPAPYPYPVIIPDPSPPQKEVHNVHCASITAITCWTDCAAYGEIPCICHTNWILLLPTSIDCECRSPSDGPAALAVCAATSVGGFLKNFASG